MKFFLSAFFLISVLPATLGQILPARNADTLVAANKVQIASSYFHDEAINNDRLIQQIEYNPDGLPISEYTLSLWDVVSYSTFKTFAYNELGKPATMTMKQEILSLYPRDGEYIEAFGDRPVYEKIQYTYSENRLPAKQEVVVYYSEKLPEDAIPNQTITFQYENELLLLEESTSTDDRIFNKNYTIEYSYDSIGNLIKSIKTFGKDRIKTTETSYKYDSAGRVSEKIVFDPGSPHNNSHQKYTYDQAGNRIGVYLYAPENSEFELQTSYEYNDHGHRIVDDFARSDFEYLENGLIKNEMREVPNMQMTFGFRTDYTYF